MIGKMGGAALIGPERENLCRRATPAEATALGGVEWIIESQGLPNLIHETVHALFFGELADDHGFDYGQIPLDLARADHRRHLWEELSCCVLSALVCAPSQADPAGFVRAWFAEQFEIQGVFHGLEHDLVGFRARIEARIAHPEHRAEFVETIAQGRRLLAEGLAAVGVAVAIPPADGLAVWRDYRSIWT